MVTLTFFSLGVKQSGPGTSSTTNHKFYKALGGRLHGPWCKQPLRVGVDYGEEVHWSRNLEEWSNMIDYNMGSSLDMVYTMPKSSPMGNFKDG